MGFHCNDFHENRADQISLKSVSKNMASERSRNCFVPLSEVWLSLNRFTASSRSFDDILEKNSTPNLYENSDKMFNGKRAHVVRTDRVLTAV